MNRAEKQRRELYVDTFFKSMKKLDSDLLKAYSESNVLDEFVLGQLRDLFQNAFSYEHEEIDRIRDVVEDWAQSVGRGDFDRWLRHFTDDAVLMPPA